MSQTKEINKTNIEIEEKVFFSEKIFAYEHIQDGHTVVVVEGQEIKGETVLTKYSTQSENISVEYKGKPLVSVDSQVIEGDPISREGKIFKKDLKSPVNGKVVEISKNIIKIEPIIKDKIKVETKIEVTGKIEKITDTKIIYSSPALIINLVEAKGELASGKIKFIPANAFAGGINLGSSLSDCIVFTDHLTQESYPILSTLGAKGVIANSIDYATYSEIIILAVPIGIIAGYGRLEEDGKLASFLRSMDGNYARLDAADRKLIIPMEKEPVWIKKHKFSISI